MTENRLKLHETLCGILGSRNVYFQPPSSVSMKYPAIIYSRSNIENKFADNSVYRQTQMYEITVVDKNPDSKIVSNISKLPKIRFNRHYVADNLNHDVFTIYY